MYFCTVQIISIKNAHKFRVYVRGRRGGGGTEILSVTVMLAAGYWLCRRLML